MLMNKIAEHMQPSNNSLPYTDKASRISITMSITGALLVVITASFLKPLLSTNQTFQFPTVTVYDPSNGLSPWEENNLDLNGDTHFVLTLHLPSPQDTDIDAKRQFDPWGGKRFSSGNTEGSRKRQFSPWGGKRSDPENSFQDSDYHSADVEVPVKSRGNQGTFNLSKAKRNFHAWGGKRHSNTKRGYLSGREDTYQWWRGKRNFNSWGGKRFVKDLKKHDTLMTNKITKTGGKRQAFHSWGGKRASDSWGSKQVMHSEPELKDLNSEEDSMPSSYSTLREGTDRNMR